MIATWIAHGKRKSEIAKALDVDTSTIWRWLRKDDELKEAVREAEDKVYREALDEVNHVAFADVEITSASKMQALFRIIDTYEAKLRRQAGEITMDDANMVLLNMCAVLMDMPEAKQRLMDAFRNPSGPEGNGNSGSGLLPEKPIIDGTAES